VPHGLEQMRAVGPQTLTRELEALEPSERRAADGLGGGVKVF